MKATEILIAEHAVIGRVLDALDEAVHNDQAAGPEFFSAAADFASGFADGCHHRKEENVLFKAMSASGAPVQGGPIGVMLSEHEQGRQLIRAMRSGAADWKNGLETGRAETLKAASQYVFLLRQHIAKENNILFPLADRLIPLNDQEQVTEDFEHVEHEETGEGVHEKYLALAESLEEQARAWAHVSR
jgi:hemerythrin-like domain-containing protein